MKTAVVLSLAIVAQAAGNVYLSKGMREMASAGQISGDDLPLILLRGIESPTIWIGTALLLAFFLLYAAALSWADLSFVLPATAFGYVVNVACGYYFLNEAVRREMDRSGADFHRSLFCCEIRSTGTWKRESG
jgi:polyferredoxin